MKSFLIFSTFLWTIFLIDATIYDRNPIISTNDGNLEIWSAEDKNISIANKGRGTFRINGIDMMKFLHGDNANATANQNPILNVKDIYSQLSRMRSWIRGKNGVLSRLDKLENGTTRGGGGRQPGARFGYRISRLEDKVNALSEKLIKDNCRSHPCQNGGTCYSMYETFKCECPNNWEGSNCGQDVNECARFAGTDLGCQNGADCINKPGSYECLCKDGWQGLHCTKRKADCLTQTSNELCGHGTCIQTANSYTCICDQGWKKADNSPACIVDVDECATSKPHCSKDPEVQCINLQGSFMCGPCPAGYTGNGFYCSDIDECAINNGGCSTSPTVQCINTRGSYHCGSCPTGFEGDGKVCRISQVTPGSNACSPDQNICGPNAICIQYPNSSPICQCKFGYTGSGVGPNGCAPVSLNPCINLMCKNGGTCIANGPVAHCQCPPGFVQPLCEPSLDPCLSYPCANGGTCIRTGFTQQYRCTCREGFSGIRCEQQARSCGGLRTGESGTIEFPQKLLNGSVRNYHPNARCAWLIKTNHTKILNITFTKFNVEYSTECKFDWLQIHDGRSSASHIIGRFCGQQLPNGGNILSTHNSLYFWFRSDNSTAHDGFELSWESIDPICGGEIEVTSHGVITSPGSPGTYPPNRNCTWNLHAPEGKRIQFLFFILKIEAHPDCGYDFLEIRSGFGDDAPVLGKYCNTTHPEPILTPSNMASVYFHSDADSTDSGFQIAYSVREGIPGCGGVFTSAKGSISSLKKSDGTYHESRTCEYRIQLPVGSRILLEFSKFSLEDSVECKFDSISIFDKIDDENKLIGKYCGTTIPPPIKSITNLVLIKFVTDWSNQLEGFELKYSMVCGGVFQNDTGFIKSPGYPRVYDGDQTCTYDIEAPLGKVVALDFIDFDMEAHDGCEFDSLEIFDGHDSNSTSLGTFCSGDKPEHIVSSYNILHLVFSVDASIGGKGFYANYSFIDVDCGGILRNPNTVIKSPMEVDGDGVYKSNAKCQWVIVAPPKHIIQLNFLSFELEEDANCQYDFVAIFNNGSGRGQRIGPFCGSNVPAVFTSIDNIVTIIFQTDQSTAKTGFTASLSFIESDKLCGANYFTSVGSIKSPGSPEYLANKNCEWIVTVPVGRQIEITFKELDIEPHTTCRFDGLEIRNGGNEMAPLIAQLCGNEMPGKMRSFGNQIYIKFYSDASRNYKGFELEWDATSVGCGGVLDTPRGSIISPGYPKGYHDNAQCEYRISVSQGSTIKVVFTDLDLEQHSDCRYDYLEVFDGSDASAISFGKFCNSENHPLHLETTGNHAFLRLNTDNSHGGRGFSLKYSINCNRTLSGFSGILESPNFPNNYLNNLDCKWRIKVNQGNKVNVEFSHFELENVNVYEAENGTHLCQYDYLEIIDGSNRAKYCNKAPASFISRDDFVDVVFHTDNSATASGFRIEYATEGCGGFLTHPYGELSSPNYPKKYPGNIVCEWIIEVDFGVGIELTIHELDMEGSEDCEYDALVVAMDSNYTHKLLSACNKKKEVLVTSNGNILYVKFSTDISHAGKGFNATYSITSIKGGCGGLYNSQSGFIYSPNYPKIYNPNQICEWRMKTDDSHSIVLMFMDFDLEKTDNCTKDYLEVLDTVTKKSLWKGCDKQLPSNNYFKSEYNQLSVILKSGDGAVYSKGFKANFTTACGSRIITNDTGNIFLRLDHNIFDNCTWVIKSGDPTKKITLTISHLYIQLPPELLCEIKLKIQDGETEDAPLKAELCGGKSPKAIVSNGDALRISITVPAEQQYYSVNEFEAHYSVLDNSCGGRLAGEHGEFASPNYPNTSPLNMFCTWNVVVSEGNILQLTVHSLDIATSENCNDNYLEVRETDSNGKLIGAYCGNEVPGNLTEAKGYWIRYKTDNSSVNAGFLAEYKYLSHNELKGPQGVLESPLYPKYVLSSREQTYRIIVAQGSVIRLTFSEFFMGEEDLSCFSYIKVFDGFDDTAPLLLDETCQDAPEPTISQTNIIFIEFLNNFYAASKFKMSWMEMNKTSIKNETINACETTVVLNNATQFVNISSPGYPYGYNASMNCKYIISSGIPGMHPVLAIRDIDLEETSDCTSDFIKIFTDRDDSSWKEIHKLCSYTVRMPLVISGTPNIKVEFVSDVNINGTGFAATANLVCGGKLDGPNGIIQLNMSSIFVRSLSRFASNCVYNITVKPGRKIEFEFLEMNLPRDGQVCVSSVIIKNGRDEESPLLGDGNYCGVNEKKTIPQTTSNRAFVKFSYRLHPGGSFKLRYREVQTECGGNLRLTLDNNSTEIASPNFPNVPDSNTECIWVIVAPVGESLRLDFVENFDLTTTPTCDDEYVELKDGSTFNARLIGLFCERSPPTQYSKGNVLRIKYFTQVTNPRNGFKAKISLAKCGGTRRSESGFIMSVGYPGSGAYPSNSKCDYKIIANFNSVFNITFMDLDLPPKEEGNCSKDKDNIQIFSVLPSINDTNDDMLSEVGRYCGQEKNPPVITQSNEVVIRFNTFAPNSVHRGFKLKFDTGKLLCGGNFEAESGEFTSPGYPNQITLGYCEWKIKVSKGRRVKIDLVDLELMQSQNRYLQRLAFYNDFKHLNRIKFLTSDEDRASVYSTDNTMMVSFWTRYSSKHKGFKIRYSSDEPSLCLGDLNQREGRLNPPVNLNLSSFVCEYVRDFQPIGANLASGTLVMNFVDVQFGRRVVYNCRYVSTVIEISRSSGNDDDRTLARICSNSTKLSILSPYPDIKILIKQSPFFGKLIFSLSYKTHECGGILRGSHSHSLRNPMFGINNYGPVDCAWLVEYSQEYKIHLKVTKFNLTLPCDKEFVKIYNGATRMHPLIGTYCGSTATLDTLSLHKNVFIEFHSDAYGIHSNFEILTDPSATGCGGIVNRYVYTIQSPVVDNQYPNNAECIWEIRADAGYHIGLQFTNRFFLEDSTNCSKDSLEIFDFVDDDWKSLGKVCGRQVPKIYNSTSDKMKLLFRTDATTAGEGFTVNWEQNCGGIIPVYEQKKTLVSPGYPTVYMGNMICNYTLVSSKSDKNINVVFKDFDLEYVNKCFYDNVTISKELDYHWNGAYEKIGTYCGGDSPGSVRAKNKMMIVFQTDRWVEKKGFMFEYYLDTCGGEIKSSQIISSPEKDGNYMGTLDCFWNITAPPNQKIIIRFEKFSLEHSEGCYFDYLEIFSGLKPLESNRLVRLCGNLTQFTSIPVKNNSALVYLKTDQSNHFPGFSAAVFFVPNCDRNIELTPQNPSYTLNLIDTNTMYSNVMECIYLVSAPQMNTITVSFKEMHLSLCEPEKNRTLPCSCDYVELKDGNSPFSSLIGRFCGHDVPLDTSTSAGALYMRFVTDSTLGSTGFKVTFTLSTPICGPPKIDLRNSSSFELVSPGRGQYNPNLRCVWQVVASEMKMIEVIFEKLDIEDSDKCSKDFLVIEDESVKEFVTEGLGENLIYRGKSSQTINPTFFMGIQSPTSPHTYCGSEIPHDYYSQSNRVNIRFQSDFENQKSGFRLKLQSISTCYRNYTSLQGRITANELSECFMTITVPENYTISLYFLRFFFIAQDCDKNFMKIYDGTFESGELLTTICGYAIPDPVFSKKNQVTLKTKVETGTIPSYGGWDISYIATDQGIGCGGQIFNYGGVFSSPLYPNVSRSNINCTWTITVPQNLKVAIKFSVFDMGSKITCENDYVEFLEDNDNETENIVRKYCGEDNPDVYQSSKNKVRVHYKKTVNFAGTGWIIHFMGVSDGATLGAW